MSAPQEIRTFFITAVTANRRSLFQVERNAELFINLLAEDQTKGRYAIHAFVIMKDHIHLLLTPAPAVSLEKAMQYIKGGFSFRLKSKGDIWERGFKEHRVKNAGDYANHVHYIEQNPVRASLVLNANEYPYSSASLQSFLAPAPPTLLERSRD